MSLDVRVTDVVSRSDLLLIRQVDGCVCVCVCACVCVCVLHFPLHGAVLRAPPRLSEHLPVIA